MNLNDIKGVQAPSLDAWSTAAALSAVTERLEIMVAVRPTFHAPALLAKQAANIDHISNGRLSLNVVSSWWVGEAGVDLLLLQFSPQYEEMERFAEEIIPHFRKTDGFAASEEYPDLTVL